jgi:GNAT superfamily N-acetyltransferase
VNFGSGRNLLAPKAFQVHPAGMSVNTRTFRILDLDPADQDQVDASYEIDKAARAFDVPDFPPPCPVHHRQSLRVPMPGEDTRHWLVHLDEVPVGWAKVDLPTLDNPDNAWLECVVHPSWRRRGAGRALYEHVAGYVVANGRTRLVGMSVEPLSVATTMTGPGSSFAVAVGAQDALRDVRRRLDVANLDWPALDAVVAEAWTHAEGYSLIHWRDRAPDTHIGDIAYLEGRMVTDAPMGKLAWEPESYDVDRMRAREAAALARGSRTYNSALRDDRTGRVVAWSDLMFEHTIGFHAWQETTIVEPEHRGHRLGTIAKIGNLRYALAAEPELRMINTWNAGVNDHMIAINELIGFRPVDVWINWQSDL